MKATVGNRNASSVWEETLYRRIRTALEDNWDAAMEVGCMDHGGFDWLAEAAYRASQGLPADVASVGLAALQRGGPGGGETVPEQYVCPECRNGKHVNCTKVVLIEQDEWVPCWCQETGHTWEGSE